MKGMELNRAVLPLYAAFINMSILPVTRPRANSGAPQDVVVVPETPEVMITYQYSYMAYDFNGLCYIESTW